MRVAILCQEEPVFLGPFLRGVIQSRPDLILAVVLAGRRSAGERRGSFRDRLQSLRIFWLIFEPADFIDSLWRRLRFGMLRSRDPNSVEGLARALDIPVHHVEGRRAADVLPVIRRLDADIVLNQSEILLDAEILDVPRIGFVNRHASLLPAHRGRLASFWTHAQEAPRYGITIHMVDQGIDTGDILVQWESKNADPRWPFPRLLRHLNARAPELFWDAIDRLARGESPTPQPPGGEEPPARFPTLDDARRYRMLLKERRE